MRRVCVIGPCGAGKSTFSIELARLTGLPVVHMDRLHWKPGWVESSREELIARLGPVLAGDAWVIDGNYGGTMAMRLARADTIVFLDYPPRLYRWRVLKRIAKGYGRTRRDMTEGCPERLNAEFLHYVWRFHRDSRPSIFEWLKALRPDQALHTFRRPREAARFIEDIRVDPSTRSVRVQ